MIKWKCLLLLLNMNGGHCTESYNSSLRSFPLPSACICAYSYLVSNMQFPMYLFSLRGIHLDQNRFLQDPSSLYKPVSDVMFSRLC